MDARRSYLVVLNPVAAMERYSRSAIATDNAAFLEQLRVAFACIDPKSYRGIDRTPLLPHPSLEESVIESFRAAGVDMDTEFAARRLYCERLAEAESKGELVDDDELTSVDDAHAIWRSLREPRNYEIIAASPQPADAGQILGFDVGWLTNYSIVCDTFVRPTWHPPDPDDHAELCEFARQMNEHVLFATWEHARQFLAWYRTRPWGEDFHCESALTVIQVEPVGLTGADR